MRFDGRRSWFVGVVAVLGVAGCAPFSAGLREDLNDGEFNEVVTDGEKWLAGHPERPEDADERRRVARVVAEARVALAARMDAVDSWVALRSKLAGRGLEDLAERALVAESHAWFRDRASVVGTLDAWRSWRHRYGTLAAAPDRQVVANNEIAAAEAETIGLGSIASERAYRKLYGTWTGVDRAMSRSRRREVDFAFADAEVRGTAAAWLAFHQDYRAWAEAADRIAEAETRGFAAAIDESAQKGDVAELERLRRLTTTPALRDHAGLQLARTLLAPHRAAIEGGRHPDTEALHALLDAHPDEPFGAALGPDATNRVIDQGLSLGDPALLRLGRVALASSDTRLSVVQAAERNAAWAHLGPASDSAAWAAFARRYPDDPRAAEADVHAGHAARLEAARTRWPRAMVTRRRILPGGRVELTADVVDCEGRRLSGFSRDDFEVLAAGESQPIARFWGLEDERPLDIALAVDLSGSMSEEHEAVRKALEHFAEAFRFRGRAARIGLVSFADEVEQRRAPTAQVGTVQGWLGDLGPPHGGAVEDGAAALATAADLTGNGPGEHVTVFLSDEIPQVGGAGRRALGMPPSGDCARYQAAAACLGRARTDQAVIGCFSRLGGQLGVRLDRCRRVYGARVCLAAVGASRLASGLETCAEPLEVDTTAGLALTRRLDRGFHRPYFIVPPFPELAQTQGTLGDPYQALADRLQGRRLEVPQDAHETRVFVTALDDVADQLSRQSVLELAPTPTPVDPNGVALLVRSAHRWTPRGAMPVEEPVALVALNADADCPDIALLGQAGVYRSAECGRQWQVQPVAGLIPPFTAAVRVGGAGARLAVVASGRAAVLDLDSGAVTALQSVPPPVTGLLSDAEGTLWLTGRGEDGQAALFEVGADAESARVALPEVGAAALPYFVHAEAGQPLPCVLGDRARVCRGRDGAWRAAGRGAPPGVDLTHARLAAVAQPTQALLLTGGDGALWRGLGASGAFVAQRPPDGAAATILSTPEGDRVCLLSSTETLCSDDLGRSFYRVGEAFERPGAVAGELIGDTLVIARNERLLRLDRVVTREIPSSAVYFDTADDHFSDALTPFLEQIAALMRADRATTLRIEGHADRRGDDAKNEELAVRRARAVSRYFESRGVGSDRLEVRGFGSRRPIRDEENEAAWSRNRRVELVLLEPVRRVRETDTCGRPQGD